MHISLFMVHEYLLAQGIFICQSRLDGGNLLQGIRVYDGSGLTQPKEKMLIGLIRQFRNTAYAEIIRNFPDDAILCICGNDYFIAAQRSLPEILNACIAVCEHYKRYEEDLMQAVHEKATLQQLIDIATPYYQNPLFVANWQGDVLAYTKNLNGKSTASLSPFWQEVTANNRILLSSVKAFAEIPEYADRLIDGKPHILNFPAFGAIVLCAAQLRKDKYHIHFQAIQHETILTQTHLHLAAAFMRVISLIDFDEQLGKAVSAASLFADLLDGKSASYENLHWVLASLGWNPCDRFLFLLFTSKTSDLVPEALYGQLKHHLKCGLCILWNGFPALFIREDDFSRDKNTIIRLSRDLGFICGVSYPIKDWLKLPVYFRQTKAAIKYRDPGSVISFCIDHTWDVLLGELLQTTEDMMLRHPAVDILQEYDKKKGTKLVFTLQTYLENERNTTLTAEELFLHRNSLQYRLRQINDLTNLDLNSAKERAHILLSCFMLKT